MNGIEKVGKKLKDNKISKEILEEIENYNKAHSEEMPKQEKFEFAALIMCGILILVILKFGLYKPLMSGNITPIVYLYVIIIIILLCIILILGKRFTSKW